MINRREEENSIIVNPKFLNVGEGCGNHLEWIGSRLKNENPFRDETREERLKRIAIQKGLIHGNGKRKKKSKKRKSKKRYN